MEQPLPMAMSSDTAFQQLSSESSPNTIRNLPLEGASMSSRVCDSCVRKKVKCSQQRPTCSRCFERGETCTYSSKRRKPGPQPGSQRASQRALRSSTIQDSPNRQQYHIGSGALNECPSPIERMTVAGDVISQETSSFGGPETAPESTNSPQVHISPQQEEYLLEKYFEIAQDANPIFSKTRFLHDYRSSLCSRELISAITLVTAKLIGFPSYDNAFIIDARIDSLLSSSLVQDDLFADVTSLDQFRKSCVLAFYEFHQFPGHQSWMRIGRLTRMAYRVGLDRLEILRTCYLEWGALNEENLEEWRAVWWCIYRLDSYSNLSSGTPYLVDESLIQTALILDPPTSSINDKDVFPKQYLPSRPEDLWKLLPVVTSNPETLISNIHNITITTMRHAGLLTRVHNLRSHEETAGHISQAERHLSALRLALPTSWLNPKRNAFTNESHADHHARLVTVLHLLMTRLLLSVLGCGRKQDEEWLIGWQQVLESCQNIASVAEQWDSSFCLTVDPAISFIVFTALIFLDLHKKSTAVSESNLRSSIDHDKTVLRLQLERFASIWTLPRLLSLSLGTFDESVEGPLSYQGVKFMLTRFEAPLHPRWLQFIASPQTYLDDLQRYQAL